MKKKESLNELRGLSLDALKSKAVELSEESMKLRFRRKTGQLSQSHQLARARKELARTLTLIKQKESESATK